ncbi:MAG: hypothetical protein PHQ04_01330 [Opitutaceae bacterium]|nr:hypothetical protein [Opitutaceae bacterium]
MLTKIGQLQNMLHSTGVKKHRKKAGKGKTGRVRRIHCSRLLTTLVRICQRLRELQSHPAVRSAYLEVEQELEVLLNRSQRQELPRLAGRREP